jgi:hypothetical protein
MRIEIRTEETYTFTPKDGTEEIHILSGRLRKWLHAKAMNKVIDLTFPEQSLEEIVAQHGLEAPRMASMTALEAADPVIVGLWPGGTHIIIDGGHRRWYWASRGVNVLRGWAVPYEVWSEFTFNPSETSVFRGRDGSLLPQRRR